MPNIKEHVDTFAKKFVPSYRFIRSQESTIDSSHLPQRELNINSIKVLNWNIAKKNYDKIWLKDFFNIVEYYQHRFDIFTRISSRIREKEIR